MPDKIIIQGVTKEGRKFRPSDWAERMCTQTASFTGGRIVCHPYVQIHSINGIKCLTVDMRLKESDQAAFDHLMDFANGNNLKIVEI